MNDRALICVVQMMTALSAAIVMGIGLALAEGMLPKRPAMMVALAIGGLAVFVVARIRDLGRNDRC